MRPRYRLRDAPRPHRHQACRAQRHDRVQDGRHERHGHYPTTLPWAGNLGGGPPFPGQAAPTPKTLCEAKPAGAAIDGAGSDRAPPMRPATSPRSSRRREAGRTKARRCSPTVRTSAPARGRRRRPARSLPAPRHCRSALVRACALSSSTHRRLRYFRLRLTDNSGNMGAADPRRRRGWNCSTTRSRRAAAKGPGSPDMTLAKSCCRPVRAPTWSLRFRRRRPGADDVDRGLSADRGGLRRRPDRSVMHSRRPPGPPRLPPTRSQPAHRSGRPPATPCRSLARRPERCSTRYVQPEERRQRLAEHQIHEHRGSGGTIGVDGTSAPLTSRTTRVAPHLFMSTRYVKPGDTLSCRSRTRSPRTIDSTCTGLDPANLAVQRPDLGTHTFTRPYHELRDNVDSRVVRHGPQFTLTFRRRIDPRPQPDGVTPGGELGRWAVPLPHLLPRDARHALRARRRPGNGKERPDINANTGQVTVNQGQTATLNGRPSDIDGEPVTLSSSVGSTTTTVVRISPRGSQRGPASSQVVIARHGT